MNLAAALLVAVLVGAILPLQGLVNARLGTHVGGPVAAAFVSFLVGTVMLGLYLLATRTPLTLQGSLKLPPWIWAGGALGAVYVACFTLLMPRKRSGRASSAARIAVSSRTSKQAVCTASPSSARRTSRRSARRPVATTCQPASTKRRAAARPKPAVAPVIRAVLGMAGAKAMAWGCPR